METSNSESVKSIDINQLLNNIVNSPDTPGKKKSPDNEVIQAKGELYEDELWLGSLQLPLMSLMLKSPCDIQEEGGTVSASNISKDSITYRVSDKRNIRINIVQTDTDNAVTSDVTIKYSFPKVSQDSQDSNEKNQSIESEDNNTLASILDRIDNIEPPEESGENNEVDLTSGSQDSFPNEKQVLENVQKEVRDTIDTDSKNNDETESVSETDTQEAVSST